MSDPSPESAGATPLPLVFDEPKGRKKPPRHLADLTADERAELATSMGLPGFRAKQLSTHYFARLVDDPAEMTDLPAAQRDELVSALLPPLMSPLRTMEADRGTTRKTLWRPLRRCPRRVGPDALPRPGDDVRVQPGRLRHGLPVLRHRPGRPAAQHVDRRDRRAGRRRCPRARPGRGPGRPGPGLERRLHGHGRAARQLQGRDRRRTPPDRPDARTGWACPPAA